MSAPLRVGGDPHGRRDGADLAEVLGIPGRLTVTASSGRSVTAVGKPSARTCDRQGGAGRAAVGRVNEEVEAAGDRIAALRGRVGGRGGAEGGDEEEAGERKGGPAALVLGHRPRGAGSALYGAARRLALRAIGPARRTV